MPLRPAQKPLDQPTVVNDGVIEMMKYLIGLGAVSIVFIGYLVLMPTPESPAPATEPAAEITPPVAAPVAPEAITPEDTATSPVDDDELLEEMAADVREGLPSVIGETLTMTDALFLPRMRIMEYTYVTTSPDARASAGELRALIEARSEPICLDGREMFELDVTLRNSFEDRDGNLLQRAYLLPEDCQRYF